MLSIYQYNDPVDYLNSYVDYKRSNTQNFSLKNFSTELGLRSSVQLVDILKRKKKISDTISRKISSYLQIDDSEIIYFQAIVERAREHDIEKKRMYDLLITELNPTVNQDFSVKYVDRELDIFEDWVYTAILSLSEIPNFDLTLASVKKKLIENVDSCRIEKALFNLLQYGFLTLDSNGKMGTTYLRTTTKAGRICDNFSSYFSMVTELAQKSLSRPLEEIKHNTFSFPIDEANIPLAKEIICKCRNQLSKISEMGHPNRVYQANLSLFPLTD